MIMICLKSLERERTKEGGTSMYKKLGIVLLACSMLLIPGCTPDEVNLQPSEEVIALKQENETLKQTITTLEEQIEELKEENEALKGSKEEDSTEEVAKESYTLYTRDVNSWEITTLGEVQVDEALSLQDKLQTVADKLSKECFEGLEIDVEEIKQIGNSDVAIINLKDKGQNESPNWMVNFFQGSTGAGITATSLEESLLQRESAYPWVDGIEIQYNSEPLVTDHIEFSNIIYR